MTKEKNLEHEWRLLALMFDNHRMSALAHLRCMLADPDKHREAAKMFLAEPPLSGEVVLAERIKKLAEEKEGK